VSRCGDRLLAGVLEELLTAVLHHDGRRRQHQQ
jgi:hypothetical protein